MRTKAHWPTRILSLIRMGRPHFLAGGFLLHGLGVVIALYTGEPLNLSALLWGQVAITATQLMTHYSNEFFDLPADQA
ncbi:MAG: prenyltransferase, partial [Anaerolineae bacterium]